MSDPPPTGGRTKSSSGSRARIEVHPTRNLRLLISSIFRVLIGTLNVMAEGLQSVCSWMNRSHKFQQYAWWSGLTAFSISLMLPFMIERYCLLGQEGGKLTRFCRGLADAIIGDQINLPRKDVIGIVYFDSQESVLNEKQQAILDGIAENMIRLLQGKASLRIEVGGHTDSTGSIGSNFELGIDRAEFVLKHLKEKGVDPAKLRMRSYGELQPFGGGSGENQPEKNRRVELRVFDIN